MRDQSKLQNIHSHLLFSHSHTHTSTLTLVNRIRFYFFKVCTAVACRLNLFFSHPFEKYQKEKLTIKHDKRNHIFCLFFTVFVVVDQLQISLFFTIFVLVLLLRMTKNFEQVNHYGRNKLANHLYEYVSPKTKAKGNVCILQKETVL